MEQIHTHISVILAAGLGTRMRSEHPKCLHKVCDRPMVDYALDAAAAVGGKAVVVVGHGREEMEQYLAGHAQTVFQSERLGTGHAVMTAREHFADIDDGYVLVLVGDMPLLRPETVVALVKKTEDEQMSACVLTARLQNPAGYGRILRRADGGVLGIVEHRDATEAQRAINEINTGVICFEVKALLWALEGLRPDNDQKEYYLTDCVGLLAKAGQSVGGYIAQDADECRGVNDRAQLAEANTILYKRTNTRLMAEGVSIVDPQSTYIGTQVSIGNDTIIYPNNFITGRTSIGSGCVIFPNNIISDTKIGTNVTIKASTMDKAVVGDNTTVGPFAYLREGANIGKSCRIGDFVEIKKSNIGDGSKASHLSYIGDADIGTGCNIGCGVVFVNYDGKNKYHTSIADKAFIGSNSNLVAPVNIGEGAFVAAGSTITEDVPADALAIARSRQTIKEDWVKDKNNTQKK